MKLDANVLRYLSKEEFRVLTAVEQGQRNVRTRCVFVVCVQKRVCVYVLLWWCGGVVVWWCGGVE